MGEDGGTTTVTNEGLPQEFRPFFTRFFERAEAAEPRVPTDPFAGERLAPVQEEQLRSLQQQSALGSQFQGLGQGAADLGQRTLAGEFLSPESNPFLQATIEAATRPILQNLQEQVLPGISSQAIQQGAFGGSREGISQAIAGSRALQSVGDVAANLAGQNLARERQLQTLAPQLLSQGAQLQQLGPQLIGQVGDIRRQLAQQPLDVQRDIFNESITAPFAGLNQFGSLLTGTNLGRQGTRETFGGGPSPVARGISGALGGAQIGNLFPGVFGAGTLGTPGQVGGLLGGLASIFF